MTTIRLTNQRGSLSLRTQDAPRHDALGATLADIETNCGLLDPADLTNLRGILEKYTGGSSAVNNMGVARAGDAADAGRKAATVVRANIERNQAVGRAYKTFWDGKNRELRDSILR